MRPRPPVRRADLIEPELSYQVVGTVLDVFHGLGPGLRESTYQKAIAKELTIRGLMFNEQVYCPIVYKGECVGLRYLDFCIAGRIIVELKCGEYFSRANIQQVKEYLEITKLSLAIIANITQGGVKFRRIVNLPK